MGKKLGKEASQDKNVQDKETSLLRVRDLFVHRNIKLIQGDKVESESNKKGQAELKEEI
jgi:hypothetical protein